MPRSKNPNPSKKKKLSSKDGIAEYYVDVSGSRVAMKEDKILQKGIDALRIVEEDVECKLLSQAALARALGIYEQDICRWRNKYPAFAELISCALSVIYARRFDKCARHSLSFNPIRVTQHLHDDEYRQVHEQNEAFRIRLATLNKDYQESKQPTVINLHSYAKADIQED